jgi:7-cyano-7-deazaguanine synthase
MPAAPSTPYAREGALVLFSGGQDSTTCLAWALERYARVETVGFDYGQRHRVELAVREPVRAGLAALKPGWAARLGSDHLLPMQTLGAISDTALTGDGAIEVGEGGLPNTFVPARNLLFLGFAAALAWRRGLGVLVAGMCETDFSGYPDCRRTTMDAMQLALTLGLDRSMEIATPLMWIDKAATWALADTLGGPGLVALIEEATHTCYRGDRSTRHAWGYGCGTCPACELRARGHAEWQTGRTTVARP